MTIVSSSSSDDVCAVVTLGTLSYTCTNSGGVLIWSSTVWIGMIGALNVTAGVPPRPPVPMLNINGVTLMESNNNNMTCISSTLTFNGSLSALTQLNSATLFCGVGLNQVNISIIVPSKNTCTCTFLFYFIFVSLIQA